MKKISLLISVVVFSLSVFSQNTNRIVFDFTGIVTDANWKKMSIHERIRALQIPEDDIHEIPTSELLEICLDFPYLIDILFSDDFQLGFKELTIEFNGFRELLLRKDLPDVVLRKSRNLTNEISKLNNNDYDKGLFSIKWLVFEMLITQDEVLSGMSDEMRSILLSSCKVNMKSKCDNPTIFSDINNIPSYLLLAKQIVYEDYIQYDKEGKDIMIRFIERPLGIPERIVPLIQEYLRSY